MRPVVDDHVDRSRVQARQRVQLSDTNWSIDLTFHQLNAFRARFQAGSGTLLRASFTLRFCPLRRGYTLEVTPVPIPNTAVKLQRADDTSWHTGGKVGRRDVKFLKPPSRDAWGLFAFRLRRRRAGRGCAVFSRGRLHQMRPHQVALSVAIVG